MRKEFASILYKHMHQDPDIMLVVGDLGYGVFDTHFKDFPDRCINTGAAEQAMMGIAVGLAISGRKVFVYSITPFLLYRPYETIRNYINHEVIPVNLIGSGRDLDYTHDGFSHDASDAKDVLKSFPHIIQYFPEEKKEISAIVTNMLQSVSPAFLSLRR